MNTYRVEVTNIKTGEVGVIYVKAPDDFAAAGQGTALKEPAKFCHGNIFADLTTGDRIAVTLFDVEAA